MKKISSSNFKGRVIFPGDAAYDAARTVFFGGIDSKPAAIIRVANREDVSRAIVFARENGLELAVRSGGHSTAGHSTTNGGLVIDVRDMNAFEMDTNTQTVWAETGLTAHELTIATDKHELAVGFGDTGSVGIGGITLNGGIGFLTRKYGLTIDNLLAAEIVTANGKTLLADSKSYPDLFWAIRGGGGNYGVATRFKYQLHKVSSVVGGMLILPATPETIFGFMEEAERAPDELSAIANIMPAPPMPMVPSEYHGKLIIMALVMYAGNTESGNRALAPFRALATPIADMVKPMRYPEIFPPEDATYHPTAASHTMFMDSVDTKLANTIINHLEASNAPMRVVQLRVLGGAMAKVATTDTAFAHRKKRILTNIASFYTGADKAEREAWVKNVSRDLYQGDSGAYVGFLGNEGESRVHAAYPGETWDRLASIKQIYDPDNLFRLNQNIPPAKNSAQE